MATLSVIVPATNAPPTLDACVAALTAAGATAEELVLVDDETVSSPAVARNIGVARATGDILVFVDADVCVHADALARIRAAFDADGELAALFGSYDDDPPATDAVSGFRNLLHHHVHHAAGGDASTFWAGLGAVRRTWFERVGGFVEHPVEDIELGMRLHAAGARLRLDPRIQGAHLKRWSVGSMIKTDLVVRGAPWVGLLLRHRSGGGGLNLGWRHRLSALAALALVAALPLAAIAGVVAASTAAAAVIMLLSLNMSFYRLLARRRGVLHAAAGVALHVVHHLVAVAAVPLGIATYVLARRKAPVAAPEIPAESPAV